MLAAVCIVRALHNLNGKPLGCPLSHSSFESTNCNGQCADACGGCARTFAQSWTSRMQPRCAAQQAAQRAMASPHCVAAHSHCSIAVAPFFLYAADSSGAQQVAGAASARTSRVTATLARAHQPSLAAGQRNSGKQRAQSHAGNAFSPNRASNMGSASRVDSASGSCQSKPFQGQMPPTLQQLQQRQRDDCLHKVSSLIHQQHGTAQRHCCCVQSVKWGFQAV